MKKLRVPRACAESPGFVGVAEWSGKWRGARLCFAMLVRAVLLLFFFASSVFAQQDPAWTAPQTPYRIVGNVYYVGSKDLASFLITTPQGNILINSNLTSSVPMIRKSVEALGFHFNDIKILLISHGHFDHASGSAEIKRLTHARYMVMDADVPVVESGGRDDFALGKSPEYWFPKTKVDHVLHDGDTVRLGDAVLVAHLTPGHTKGCTTWTMKVTDGGHVYNVVIVGSASFLSSYKMVGDPAYPGMAQDFERTFRTLKALPCDVFLGAHGIYYGMLEKFDAMKAGAANPFIDPAGYQSFVAAKDQEFRAELAKQIAASHRP
jgi:metallo-beta-lactamase class B